MKNILVITLGNRDLQFMGNIPLRFIDYTQKNNENDDSRIINNRSKEITFLDISKLLLDNLDEILPYLFFPMIENTLHYLKTAYPTLAWELVFVTTDQQPNDKQDCVFIAQICKQVFTQRGYKASVNNFGCVPTDFSSLTIFFASLFDTLLINGDVNKFVVTNSGGTPDMRAASYAAGFFKEFEYLTIEAKTQQVNKQNFKSLENKVLEVTIRKMLDTFDYQGILNLPVSDTVKSIAANALNHYNLNVTTGFVQLKNKPGEPYHEKAKFVLELLIDNMRVCYYQGRYAEALQRLFRIEEATWYLLYYLFLQENGFVNKNNPNKIDFQDSSTLRSVEFNKIINFGLDYNSRLLKNHYPEKIETNDKGEDLLIIAGGNTPLSGKNIYYHLFTQFGYAADFTSFFATINKDDEGRVYTRNSKLNGLRNKSFLGHGLEGVQQSELDNLFPDNNFALFDATLRALYKDIMGKIPKKIFDAFNADILAAFYQQLVLQ